MELVPPQHKNLAKYPLNTKIILSSEQIIYQHSQILALWGGKLSYSKNLGRGQSYIRSTLIYFKAIFVIISVKKNQEISRFGPLVMREYVVEQCFYFRFLTFLRNFYTNVSIILINKQHLNL